MHNFTINNKCEGCGYCAALCNNGAIQIRMSDGFLRAAYIDGVDHQNDECTEKRCPLEIKPVLNQVQERYVVHHKQIERRLEGSAGNVVGALMETVAKDDYYFAGTVFDDQMRVKHILTNNPEEISRLAGYKPVQSDCSSVYVQIKQKLEDGEKVLFFGTPMQCHALKQFVVNCENLTLVDIIMSGVVTQDLLDKYINEIEKREGCIVKHIRFCNKEFSYKHAKRITLDNGRTIYTKHDESFDKLVQSGYFTKSLLSDKIFSAINQRVGDMTISAYSPKMDDGLGCSYLSVNTQKGRELFNKAQKRLVVDCHSDEIEQSRIQKNSPAQLSEKTLSLLREKSLDEIFQENKGNGLIQKCKEYFGSYYRMFVKLKNVSQLRPIPLYYFIKYNFLTKGIKTDFRHNGFIYISPYSKLSLSKKAEIELHGPLEIGVKRVRGSKLETRLWMKPYSKILVHERCMFGYGSNVEVYSGGLLEVGNLYSNAELIIICAKHIKLGNTVNIAKGSTVRDTNGHLVAMPGYKQTRPVEIGNHTWICSNSTIMPGVEIGDGAIVGANSFVCKSVKPFTLVQGNPAEVVGHPQYFKM